MEMLQQLFSYICGQRNCFVIDGAVLPVCQRCFGLYVGAAVTAVWLAAGGIWRRGLPSRSVFVADVTVLVAALLGGLHAINAGATWRVLCGLWTGHVAMVWLVGGAVHLRTLSRPERAQLPWRRRDKLAGVAALGVFVAIAGMIAKLLVLGAAVWTSVACIGAACLLVATSAAAGRLVAYLPGVLLRRGLDDTDGKIVPGPADN